MPRKTDETRAVDLHVGRAIRQARAARGLTQGQVAAIAGVTYQQLHKYEQGINRVTCGRLARIASALGVPVADLFPPLPPAGLPKVDLPDEIMGLATKKLRMVRDLARSIARLG
jgi:transcriptional regulator with XRE-family HTH domain